MACITGSNELYHHGILGMKWGVRRYQPYGTGYSPDHAGRNVGLAARLAGQGSSYSSLYGGRSSSSRDSIGSSLRKGVASAALGADILAGRAKKAISESSRRASSALSDYGKKAGSVAKRFAAEVGTSAALIGGRSGIQSRYSDRTSSRSTSPLSEIGGSLSKNRLDYYSPKQISDFGRAVASRTTLDDLGRSYFTKPLLDMKRVRFDEEIEEYRGKYVEKFLRSNPPYNERLVGARETGLGRSYIEELEKTLFKL